MEIREQYWGVEKLGAYPFLDYGEAGQLTGRSSAIFQPFPALFRQNLLDIPNHSKLQGFDSSWRGFKIKTNVFALT